MVKEEKIKEILNAMQEVEEDIVILHNNIAKAREYLINNKSEDIDADYFELYKFSLAWRNMVNDLKEAFKNIDFSKLAELVNGSEDNEQ